jgi:hypothetical protein
MDGGPTEFGSRNRRPERSPFGWQQTAASDWEYVETPPDASEQTTARMPVTGGSATGMPNVSPQGTPPSEEDADAKGSSGAWMAAVVGDMSTVPHTPAIRRTIPPGSSTRDDWRDAHWDQMGNGGYLHALSRPLAEERLADESTHRLPSASQPFPSHGSRQHYPQLESGPLGPGMWAVIQEITGVGILRARVRAELPYRLAMRMWRRLAIFMLLIGILVTLAIAGHAAYAFGK